MAHGIRIGEKEMGIAPYWADGAAEYLIRAYPGKKKFVCAAGISPSGPVHFGNFREIATTFAVVRALKDRGKDAELIFSWDNFDRFRKVPADLDAAYKEHIGKPLSAVPSPADLNHSYAEEYQREFEDAMKQFRMPITYKYQTALYTSGAYDRHIITAMQQRETIANILLAHMTDKGKEMKGIRDDEYIQQYYPISVYSRFTGKDATDILAYDGHTTVRYRCNITKKEDEIDITREHVVKLSWKVDWAMRWMYEDVCFEPAGSDHNAPGGSYDVSSAIVKEIFNAESPVSTEFGFVGLRGLGTKMSGSSGKNITPQTLLTIYEPALLVWMYLRRLPKQTFSLAFDTEVYRQYDELDKALQRPVPSIFNRLFRKKESTVEVAEERVLRTIRRLYPENIGRNPISFRQLVGLAQVAGWDEQRLYTLLGNMKQAFDRISIQTRLPKAKAWVTQYNTNALITVRDEPNGEAWEEIDAEDREYVRQVYEYLRERGADDLLETESFLYSLPKARHADEKELKKAQRKLFKTIYLLLIGKETGPRLSTFLWSLPKETALRLLEQQKR